MNEKVVQEEQLDQLPELSTVGMLGLSSDTAAGACYAFNESSIFEVNVVKSLFCANGHLCTNQKACCDTWTACRLYANDP